MKELITAFVKCTDFDGRTGKREYWIFMLYSFLLSIVVGFTGGFMGEDPKTLSDIFQLVMFLPYLSMGVRRMHDINKSGWFIWIPLYNLYLACQDSVEEGNEYPK